MKSSFDPVSTGGAFAVMFACLALGFPGLAHAADCDVDSDGDVDRLDVKLIVLDRNTPASGSGDPRDADGDGNISMLDARTCIRRCNLPNCEIIGAKPSPPSGDSSRTQSRQSVPIQDATGTVGKSDLSNIAGNGWRVKKGDTLYAIGRAIFPGDVRRQAQLRNDIVRLNPSVFANGANTMSVGVFLKLPDYVISRGSSSKAVVTDSVVAPLPVEAAPKPEAPPPAPALVVEPETETRQSDSSAPEKTLTSEPVEKAEKEEIRVEEKAASPRSRAKGDIIASIGFAYGGDEVADVDSGLDFLAGSGLHFRLGYEQFFSRGRGYRVLLGTQYSKTVGGGDDATLRDTYLQAAYQYRADDLVYGIGITAQSGATLENDVDVTIDYDAANGIVIYLENVGNGNLAGWGLSYTSIELDEKDTDETADASRAEVYYSWRF